jgi:two-component system, OmpR family, sensor histidine kinase KdpD
MTPARGPRGEALAWAAWLAALAVLTAAMASVRAELDGAHVALGYLLLVLAGSARGGRTRGMVLALLAFLAFNFFFLPPFGTFVVHDPLDWIVLFTFLAVSGVATQLLYRARDEAAVAGRRAEEVERLSTLGAETLNAARAEDALGAIAEVIRGTLALDVCEVFLPAEGGGLVLAARAGGPAPEGVPAAAALAAERGTGVVERIDGTLRLLPTAATDVPEVPETAAASLPLRVRERLVGVLRIRRDSGLVVDAAQRRFFAALAYYAALGAERARLGAEVRHAEALREADRLKDALLAAVSHDLRTPLTAIKALAHDIAGEGDARAVDIEEQADRLNRLVADLLDLSRLNAGALQLRPEIAAAEDLVGAALQSVAGTLDGREVRASLAGGDPILVGRFDFVHALRVLVNLLENAHKYSPAGAPIELAAAREGDRLAFRVADRGPGIAPEEREHVFEPFTRRRGQAPDVGGAGLGLSISRRLAEAQDGSLCYEPRPGGGSVFVFSVPAAELPASLSPPAPRP